ncbi:PREDICTED: uncharacterized protein LOC108971126 [Bactrocera latifrons]|uniref:uncharacterized protein LOC108971126 n=1 Tax=Bactrocera latifrons TaxID=174628 RepID=UPI0008DE028B|nr:PREDICTED: uncharacterized protein LOC108971126 [Bactrocera latifrons]
MPWGHQLKMLSCRGRFLLIENTKQKRSFPSSIEAAKWRRLIEAAGLKACVEGITNVSAFGNNPTTQASTFTVNCDSCDEEANPFPSSLPVPTTSKQSLLATTTTTSTEKTPSTLRRKSRSDEKLELLQQNMKSLSAFQKGIDQKLKRLVAAQEKMLALQEKMVAMKMEKHRIQQSTRELDHEINKLELETLRRSLF